jgi:hypothetical protein
MTMDMYDVVGLYQSGAPPIATGGVVVDEYNNPGTMTPGIVTGFIQPVLDDYQGPGNALTDYSNIYQPQVSAPAVIPPGMAVSVGGSLYTPNTGLNYLLNGSGDPNVMKAGVPAVSVAPVAAVSGVSNLLSGGEKVADLSGILTSLNSAMGVAQQSGLLGAVATAASGGTKGTTVGGTILSRSRGVLTIRATNGKTYTVKLRKHSRRTGRRSSGMGVNFNQLLKYKMMKDMLKGV